MEGLQVGTLKTGRTVISHPLSANTESNFLARG
jgi:hypothetical protein